VCAWILFLLLNTHHVGLSGNVRDLEKGLFHFLVSESVALLKTHFMPC